MLNAAAAAATPIAGASTAGRGARSRAPGTYSHTGWYVRNRAVKCIDVAAIFDRWIDAFAKALERGRKDGSIRREVNARKVAAFIVASIEGSFGLAKNAKSAPLLRENLMVLGGYLESLRAEPKSATRRRAAIKRRPSR